MRPCSKCQSKSLLLLELISITIFPVVLEAQQLKVFPEVTGYLGEAAISLPCQFIRGPNNESISQLQWDFEPLKGNKTRIIVFSSQHGVNRLESPLKERVEIAGHSLTIRDVEMKDAGVYTCSVATFPSGSFEGKTHLTVKRKFPLSSGEIAAVVMAVVLLVGLLAAIAYFIIRHSPSVKLHVCIDTAGPGMDVARQSALRDEDVVYTDVKVKRSRDATPSFNPKHTERKHGGDVTYAEVVVLSQQPR
ncbi:Nectin-4 Ig superfamily receptor LNIR Nectin cell adhesion molecule 4 [Channa argus]|uniref:Nectin-4 Ig superfamily receptor LNIR Nectin cell adhesion molecule 4 n=1 Tax=Channa argus TaxID=215402 RepID=A0A6G1PQ56_CHAAH|nr:Nectin-4 Ig superfamily receptor LNIR Nectin cell adhesion molecule 4 [Channa argus]